MARFTDGGDKNAAEYVRTEARSGGARPDAFLVFPNMTNTALSALVTAWTTTMIATTLFLAMLALSRVWDAAVFFQALQDAINLNV